MATLYKHGPLRGIYRIHGDRYACFESGTVLRNRRMPGGWAGWTKTAFNTDRLLMGNLAQPDDSAEAQAMMTRATAANHVHEGTKLRRRIERRL